MDLSGEPALTTVTTAFDNYQYFTLTPKTNLRYNYNPVHRSKTGMAKDVRRKM